MKKLILSVCILLLFSFTSFEQVYDYSITRMNGEETFLSIYAGKHIMITVLPSVQNDSNAQILYALDSLHSMYADSVVMIGIPSYEDGYADDSMQSIMNWYASILDSSFIICQGMNTGKTSPYQSGLFNWLTHAEMNGHFDEDAMGPGEKFFINREGLLFGLVSPGAAFGAGDMEELMKH